QPGALVQDQDKLLFRTTASNTLSLAELHAVRFAATSLPPLRSARQHRLVLPDNQQLTIELLAVDEQRIGYRTAWSGDASVPRAGVVALTQLPGQTTFLAEDFETLWKSATVRGSPTLGSLRSPSGQRPLVLNAPGQE